MNCRDIEELIFAERDGVLDAARSAKLEEHAAGCDSCRKLRTALAEAADAWRHETANAKLPDVGAEWERLRARLQGEEVRLPERKRIAPVYWFGLPAAAAAAVALGIFLSRPVPTTEPSVVLAATPPVEPVSAQVEYVEVSDEDASPMVFLDKESGWLVVWAVETTATDKG